MSPWLADLGDDSGKQLQSVDFLPLQGRVELRTQKALRSGFTRSPCPSAKSSEPSRRPSRPARHRGLGIAGKSPGKDSSSENLDGSLLPPARPEALPHREIAPWETGRAGTVPRLAPRRSRRSSGAHHVKAGGRGRTSRTASRRPDRASGTRPGTLAVFGLRRLWGSSSRAARRPSTEVFQRTR